VSERASLTIQDIDSARMVIHVQQGKGRKDRYVMIGSGASALPPAPVSAPNERRGWRSFKPLRSRKLEGWSRTLNGEGSEFGRRAGRGGARIPFYRAIAMVRSLLLGAAQFGGVVSGLWGGERAAGFGSSELQTRAHNFM